MARLTCWTVGANPVPLLTCLGGDVVLTELDQFSSHELRFAASDARIIAALAPWTLLEIVQDGVGTIAYGYSVNPRQDIANTGEDTITLRLEQITHEMTWHRTRRGWQAQNNISIVQNRLAALAPGWTGVFTDVGEVDDQGQPLDLVVQVKLNNPTVLAGYLQLAQQFSQHVRLGFLVDINGNILRTIEMGQFGAAPTVTLQDAKGGDPAAMAANATIRLLATAAWQPNDVEEFCNVTVPFGGGQDTDSLVTLERLWRVINDPLYPDAGRWGSDADSQARTGKPSLFPEYDPAYPISDPEHPPTGALQWTFTDANDTPVAGTFAVVIGPPAADGTRPTQVWDSLGHPRSDVFATLMQGQFNTRGVTLDGHFDYLVYDAASYLTYGHKETKDFIDSSLNYTSANPEDQYYTERALYQEIVTFFKRYAHPHHAFTCTVNDAQTVPTRAGDLVATDFQQVSVGEDAAVVEINITENFRVMSVVRTFDGDNPATDTYTLSNLGRFDATDATGQADTAATIVALQRQQGTGLAPYTRDYAGNIDAVNPITIYVYVPKLHFQWREFRVQCDWFPFRGTANTAYSDPSIPISLQADISVAHGTHALTGTFPTQNANVPVMDTHIHTIEIAANTGGTPNVHVAVSGGAGLFGATSGGRAKVSTDTPTYDTNHSHQTPITNAPLTLEHPTTLMGKLPTHTHLIEQRIPAGQPSPVAITLSINGVGLSSGVAASGSRNTSGAFTSAFVVNDIAVQMDAAGSPGAVVPLRFDAGTSSGNPNGVGWLQISVTAVEELGGLSSTFRAS